MIDWADLFMQIAQVVSQRSKDPRTQVGAVIVNQRREILGVGFNGPPSCIHDSIVDFDSEDKYSWVIHAEVNAILFALKHGDIKNSILYTTAFPCANCVLVAAQVGVRRIVHANVIPSMCQNTQGLSAFICDKAGINLQVYKKKI